jgi:hypothetical protein
MKPSQKPAPREVNVGVEVVFWQISGILIGSLIWLPIWGVLLRQSDAERLAISNVEALAGLVCTGPVITMAMGGILGSIWGAHRARQQARQEANEFGD